MEYYSTNLKNGTMSQGAIALDILIGAQGEDLQGITTQVSNWYAGLDLDKIEAMDEEHFQGALSSGPEDSPEDLLHCPLITPGNLSLQMLEHTDETAWFRTELNPDTPYEVTIYLKEGADSLRVGRTVPPTRMRER